MKKLTGLVVVFILMVNSLYSSPLVFKITKEVKGNDVVELATFDASKYKQIRIRIKFSNKDNDLIELESNKLDDRFNKGLISKQLYYSERSELAFKRIIPNLYFYAVEMGDEMSLFLEGYSQVIDSPPSKIKISVKSEGIYSLYVWASQ